MIKRTILLISICLLIYNCSSQEPETASKVFILFRPNFTFYGEIDKKLLDENMSPEERYQAITNSVSRLDSEYNNKFNLFRDCKALKSYNNGELGSWNINRVSLFDSDLLDNENKLDGISILIDFTATLADYRCSLEAVKESISNSSANKMASDLELEISENTVVSERLSWQWNGVDNPTGKLASRIIEYVRDIDLGYQEINTDSGVRLIPNNSRWFERGISVIDLLSHELKINSIKIAIDPFTIIQNHDLSEMTKSELFYLINTPYISRRVPTEEGFSINPDINNADLEMLVHMVSQEGINTGTVQDKINDIFFSSTDPYYDEFYRRVMGLCSEGKCYSLQTLKVIMNMYSSLAPELTAVIAKLLLEKGRIDKGMTLYTGNKYEKLKDLYSQIYTQFSALTKGLPLTTLPPETSELQQISELYTNVVKTKLDLEPTINKGEVVIAGRQQVIQIFTSLLALTGISYVFSNLAIRTIQNPPVIDPGIDEIVRENLRNAEDKALHLEGRKLPTQNPTPNNPAPIIPPFNLLGATEDEEERIAREFLDLLKSSDAENKLEEMPCQDRVTKSRITLQHSIKQMLKPGGTRINNGQLEKLVNGYYVPFKQLPDGKSIEIIRDKFELDDLIKKCGKIPAYNRLYRDGSISNNTEFVAIRLKPCNKVLFIHTTKDYNSNSDGGRDPTTDCESIRVEYASICDPLLGQTAFRSNENTALFTLFSTNPAMNLTRWASKIWERLIIGTLEGKGLFDGLDGC